MKSIAGSVKYRAKYIARSIMRTFSVWRQSRRIKASLHEGEKGLFIDCGGNLGQGFTFFTQFFTPDKFEYIVIEPNPYCQATLRHVVSKKANGSKFEIIEKAASNSDGTCLFYGLSPAQGGSYSEGASIISDHNTKYYSSSRNDAIEVGTISLAELINKCANDYDVIVLKLDVEGAEYSIMPHLFKTGAAQKLKQLYIEFHSQDVSIDLQPERERIENEIIKTLSHLNIGFTRWI